MKSSIGKSVVIGFIAGMAASWIKAEVEKPLQKIGEKLYPPKEEDLLLKGADVTNHPEKMPPAVLANEISLYLTGKELSDEEKKKYMSIIHYAMGVFISTIYVDVVNRNEFLGFDNGITAGMVIWYMTHGTTIPSLGLQGPVEDMPKSWWVWEFGSHIVYGISIETMRKVLVKI